MTKKNVFFNLTFVAIIASFIFILAYLVAGEPYVGVGDYYDQQIAFYRHAHEFIRSGNWLWDWSAELGSEFIPTYSFYLVFSPFFLITLLFPTDWIIFLMPILNILKIVLADGMALLFFKDKFKKKEFVFLSAFLYAFCGWMFNSLFFNHFIEVMAIFPLYLWSFDNVVAGKKKYWFGILTTVSILINYFFWFGEVVFIALYFFVRLIFDKEYKVTKYGIIRFIIEGILGVCLTGIFLVPIINVVFRNPRANDKISEGIFMYQDIEMYFSIIQSAIHFPHITIWEEGWFNILQFGCPSQTLYIGGIGIFLVPAFFIKSKRKWLKIFIVLLSIFAMVPVLNSSFALFSSTYYARWFYMFTFFLIWASISLLDDIEIKNNKKIIFISFIIVIALYIVCCFVGYKTHISIGEKVNENSIMFSVTTFIASVFGYMICICQKNCKRFLFATIIVTSILSLAFYIYGFDYYKNIGKYKEESYSMIKEIIDSEINDDSEFYRIYNSTYTNTGLLKNKSSISGYNSIVPNSVYDFYTLINKKREVISDFIKEDSSVLDILSTKYIYNQDKKEWEFNNDYFPMGIIFSDIEEVLDYNKLRIEESDFSNKLYLSTVDYFKYKHLDDTENIYLGKKVIDIDGVEVTIESYNSKDVYTYKSNKYLTIPGICVKGNSIFINGTSIKTFPFASKMGNDLLVKSRGNTEVVVKKNIYDVLSANLTNMNFSQYGFSANSNLEKTSLVFFSIPYDDLWSAYIDGKEVEIIKGDNAFIVLEVPEGEHFIEIKYSTELYRFGGYITGVTAVLFVGYIIITNRKKKIVV